MPGVAGYADDFHQTSRSYALFSNETYAISGNWDLTAGFRYTHEKKTLRSNYNDTDAGAGCGSLLRSPGVAAMNPASPEYQFLLGYGCSVVFNSFFAKLSNTQSLTENNLSGTIKSVLAGCVLMTIGSLIAGIPDPFAPIRLFRLFVVIVVTAFTLISLMFLIMVRVTDPLVPRAIFGVLNTLLYFPSGAVYPQQGFPGWMQVIAAVDPFTYSVHALKSLLLKNTGFEAITGDLAYLAVFSVVAMTAATLLFRRTL